MSIQSELAEALADEIREKSDREVLIEVKGYNVRIAIYPKGEKPSVNNANRIWQFWLNTHDASWHFNITASPKFAPEDAAAAGAVMLFMGYCRLGPGSRDSAETILRKLSKQYAGKE